jgi:hypothetical protein
MESVARKIEVKAVFQELARVLVVTQGGDAVTVRTAFADVLAKRAASCLLDPAAGDRVLLATEEGGDAYVLAVLEKADKGASTISVDGDLTLRSTVDITGIEELSVLGGAVKAELGKVKLYASTLDGFFERIRSHAKNSHRTVEELDQVNARHIDYAAQESAHLRGENALVTAHHLVKVNGEQVHVG